MFGRPMSLLLLPAALEGAAALSNYMLRTAQGHGHEAVLHAPYGGTCATGPLCQGGWPQLTSGAT